MMENEIILPKEKLDMTAENLTNIATAELAETIKTDTVLDDDKQGVVLHEAAVNIKTVTAEAIPTEASVEMIEQLEDISAEDPVVENPLEENLEEKLTAAIEALERNLEETIKEGNKERPAEALQGIIKDEAIEEPEEMIVEPDPRVGKVRATPAARRIAREFKVELEKATGTGPNGRIEADDVKKLVVIQPGTFDYKSKEPVVIGTSLDKIAGNPSNLFSTPKKLEEIPDKKPRSRKKLKDMNQKLEKLPNPELDFVPFVDENDKKLEEKDADVVTKISALDFVPFVDLKAEPLREEIIVKPTPMHLLYESELEDQGGKNKKIRGLSRKNQVPGKNGINAPATCTSPTTKAAGDEEKDVATPSFITEKMELEVDHPTDELSANDKLTASDSDIMKAEVTEVAKTKSIMAAENMGLEAAVNTTEKSNEDQETSAVRQITTANGSRSEPDLSEIEKNNQEKNQVRPVRFKAIRKYRVKNKVEIPVISLTTEIDMTEIKDLRKKITKKIEEQARYRCTYTDFLLLATARALVKHPLINARREEGQIIAQAHVNMGLTVESEQGFIVPVIPNAQAMNFVEIVKSRGDLLKAVKNKHLAQDQLEGSTFTITNLGMYGIREFTAIINQSNSGILSVGEVVQRIRIHQGEPVVRSVMKISLNLDQRVATGVDGAKFLQEIKADMENPSLLLF